MSDKPKIRERIVTILSQAGTQLGFEAIYAALEADGYGLPAEKPKLKIRRILFDTETFSATQGEYSLAGAAESDEPELVVPKLVETPKPTAQAANALEALTPEPEPEPAPAAPPAVPEAAPVKWTLRQRIMTLLAGQEEGLSFDQVYAALEQDGFPMPVDKPKLKVRKILYDAEMFTTAGKGMFVLLEGIAPPGPAPEPPPPGSQPTPAPTPRKKPSAAGTKRPGMKPGMKSGRPAGKPGATRKAAASKPPAPTGPKRPLRDRIITALNTTGKPMTFEEVYAVIEKDGFAMPADKPKLKVRRALFDKATFATAGKGLYEVQPGIEAAPAPAAAPPIPAAAAAPAPVAPIDPSAFADDPEVKAAAAQAAKEAAAAARKEAEAIAAEAAKEAATVARQAAIEAAKQAAVEQARQVAMEQAKQAAIEAAKKAAVEQARQSAVEQAREMATKAAQEAAAQATQEAAGAAQEAAAEAVKAVTAEAVEAARQAAQAAAQEAAKQASSEIAPPQPAAPAPAVPAAPTPSATGSVNSATANQEALQASRRSGKGSLRERAATAILEADKPLTGDEVFEALANDGFPLPRKNPRQVLQKVLDNRDLFAITDDGKYVPMVEE